MEKNIKSINYNFMMNLIMTVSSTLFPLITFPYISRVLLAEGSGKSNFAVGVVAYFAMVASVGIPNYGIRACARVRDNKEELSKVTQELLIISFFTTLFIYIVFIASLFIIPTFSQRKITLLVASTLIWLNVIGVTWFYSGLEQYSYITKMSVIFKAVAMILMFVFVKDSQDYVIYTAITVISTGGSYLFNFINLRKFISFKHIQKYELKRHFKPILLFFATAIASTVATSLDTVMLGFMKGDVSVGYYGVAVKVKTVLISVVTSLGTVLLPRLSYYISEGKDKEFNEIIAKSFNFIMLCATAVSAYFIFFAKDVVLVLAGEDFVGAIRPMQFMMPTVLLIGLSNITGLQILVPKGFENKVMISIGTGAAINIILNFILIPTLNVSGAAIATVISDILALAIQFFMLKDMLIPIIKSGFKNNLKILVSLTIASIVSLLIGRFLFVGNYEVTYCLLRLAITFAAFCGVYAISLLLLKEKFVKEDVVPIGMKLVNKVFKRSKV